MEPEWSNTDAVCRILVVEPNPQVGRWVARLIEKCPWAASAGLLTGLDDLISSVERLNADTLLLDLDALNAFDSQLITKIKASHPRLDVILMDYDSSPSLRRMAIRMGADGLVGKERIMEGLWEHKRTAPPPKRREK